jgi:hypothetical protein
MKVYKFRLMKKNINETKEFPIIVKRIPANSEKLARRLLSEYQDFDAFNVMSVETVPY